MINITEPGLVLSHCLSFHTLQLFHLQTPANRLSVHHILLTDTYYTQKLSITLSPTSEKKSHQLSIHRGIRYHTVYYSPTISMIEIDPSGDLVVKATEIIKDDNGQQVSSRTETFRIRRQIMRQASAPWSEMFDPYRPYREGAKDAVEFEETPIFSFEVLLRELHHNTRASHAYDASILNIW